LAGVVFLAFFGRALLLFGHGEGAPRDARRSQRVELDGHPGHRRLGFLALAARRLRLLAHLRFGLRERGGAAASLSELLALLGELELERVALGLQRRDVARRLPGRLGEALLLDVQLALGAGERGDQLVSREPARLVLELEPLHLLLERAPRSRLRRQVLAEVRGPRLRRARDELLRARLLARPLRLEARELGLARRDPEPRGAERDERDHDRRHPPK